MAPSWPVRAGQVPIETQFLLAALPGSKGFVVLLPLVSGSFRATLFGAAGRGRPWRDAVVSAALSALGLQTALGGAVAAAGAADRGGASGEALSLRAESGDPAVTALSMPQALFVGVGRDPHEAVAAAFEAVSRELGTFAVRHAKSTPPLLRKFGWCTWNAFFSAVHPAGVLAGLASLEAGGTPARFLILDDGWQSVACPPRGRPAATAALSTATGSVAGSVVGSVAGGSAPPAEAPAAPNSSTWAAYGGTDSICSGDTGGGSSSSSGVSAKWFREAAMAKARARRALGDAPRSDRPSEQASSSLSSALDLLSPGGGGGGGGGGDSMDGGPLPSLASQRLAAAVGAWYERHVAHASPHALPVELWRLLSRTVLRAPLLAFFDRGTDFSKRLTSVRANAKFEAPRAAAAAAAAVAAAASVAGGSSASFSSSSSSSSSSSKLDRRVGADDETFRGFVGAAKASFGLDLVYAWHTLQGYWGGVSLHSSELAHLEPFALHGEFGGGDGGSGGGSGGGDHGGSRARSGWARGGGGPSVPFLAELEPSTAWDPGALGGVGALPPVKSLDLYRCLHGYLKGAGVDGVKVRSAPIAFVLAAGLYKPQLVRLAPPT